jgi:hypothetical protein
MLSIIIDIVSNESNEKIQTLEVASLLCLFMDHKSLPTTLRRLFHTYPNSHTNYVSDSILYVHLSLVIKIIYYYNSNLYTGTSCYPTDLACALALKALLSMSTHRFPPSINIKHHLLSLDEFTEAFSIALKLMLEILDIKSGSLSTH